LEHKVSKGEEGVEAGLPLGAEHVGEGAVLGGLGGGGGGGEELLGGGELAPPVTHGGVGAHQGVDVAEVGRLLVAGQGRGGGRVEGRGAGRRAGAR